MRHQLHKNTLLFGLIAICGFFFLAISGSVLAEGIEPPYLIYLPSILANIWSTTTVDAPRYFSDMGSRAVQFGTSDRPRIVYGNDHLYYGSYDGTRWNVQTVDSDPGVGRFATLAMDTSFNPNIAYYDETNGMLRFAYWDGTQWIIEKVDGTEEISGSQPLNESVSEEAGESSPPLFGLVSNKQGVGGYPSLALDNAGQPRIAYYDFDLKNLKYAHKESGTWIIETVDTTGDVGQYASLALSSFGSPMIAYYDASNGNLKLASIPSSTWTSSTIDSSTNNVGSYASLVLDSSDQPRIAYYDATKKQLRYWRNSTSIVLGTNIGQYASLQLDSMGRPWIAYFEEANDDLGLIYLTSIGEGGEWVSKKVDTGSFVGRFASLAIGTNDQRGIVYYHSSSSQLRYAQLTNTANRIDVIDTSIITGIQTSMALAGDQPRIAYLNDSQNKLMYAYNGSDGWKTEVVISQNNTGVYPSLATTSSGVPHLVFRQYESTSDNGIVSSLRYTVRGSKWSTAEIVDKGIGIGLYSSLAVNASGTPYISYFDDNGNNLKYARKVGGSWAIDTIDSTGDVGRYSSLALDSYSLPWISYWDAGNSDLKVAHKNTNGTWSIWKPATTGSVGAYSSIAIGPGNVPYVVYRDETNKTLLLAIYKNGAWTTQQIDTVGTENSIVVNSSGNIFISYYDDVNYNLKLAYNLGSGWEYEVVDASGDVGMYNALVCTSDKRCMIAYLDATNGDLKFTERKPIQ